MRRSEKMISDRGRVEEILREARVCRIAWNGSPFPYVIPVNFVYDEGTIWFHCALEGEKLDRLKVDPHVCVEVDEELAVRESGRACAWGLSYRSVIARGRAEQVRDPRAKAAALQLLMLKYSGRAGWEIPAAELSRVGVVAISLSEITGKESV